MKEVAIRILLIAVVVFMVGCDPGTVTPGDYAKDSSPEEEAPDSSAGEGFEQLLPGSYWAEPLQRYQRRYYFRDEHTGELHYFGAHEGYIISVHEHTWSAAGDSILFFVPYSGRIRMDEGDNWQEIPEDQMDLPYWYDTKLSSNGDTLSFWNDYLEELEHFIRQEYIPEP